MGKTIVFSLAVITLSSIPLMALQADSSAQQSTTATAADAQAHASGGASAQVKPGDTQLNGNAEGNATVRGQGDAKGSVNGSADSGGQMRSVKGELQGKLDSKSAKVGDPVMVKTTEKMRFSDGTEVPKGSRLVGHVTQVQARGSGHTDSSMGIVFDRAELRSGQSFAIHSVIQSVLPPASAMAASQMSADDSISTPMGGGVHTMGGGGMNGGGRAGGGLLPGTVGTATSATGALSSDLKSTAGSAVGLTGGVAEDATAGVGNGIGGAASVTGSLAAHATGIADLMLAADASGSTSGMLSATGKNIHLDSGTQMVLGVFATGGR